MLTLTYKMLTLCLSRICQSDVCGVSIASLYFKMKSKIICLHHTCCLIIDIIVCKYQKEYLQIIDNKHSFVKIEVIAFWYNFYHLYVRVSILLAWLECFSMLLLVYHLVKKIKPTWHYLTLHRIRRTIMPLSHIEWMNYVTSDMTRYQRSLDVNGSLDNFF
jgi:hypothetical protein